MVKDYDSETLYHLGKANVVVNILILKSVGSLDGYMRMRISIDSLLLDLIRGVQLE